MSKSTNKTISEMSVRELEKMLENLPKESELASRVREVLKSSETVKAVAALKDSVVTSSDSILMAADAAVGKTINLTSSVVQLYGPVAFETAGRVADGINSYLDTKLKARAIRKEIERRIKETKVSEQ
jgi:hypothetical protein